MSLFDGFKRKKAEEKKESIKDEITNLSTVNDASPYLPRLLRILAQQKQLVYIALLPYQAHFG